MEGSISSLESFCKVFRDAALIEILSQYSESCLGLYVPTSCDPGRDLVIIGRMFLGPKKRGWSRGSGDGVTGNQQSLSSISNWKRFLIRSVQFCTFGSRYVCRVHKGAFFVEDGYAVVALVHRLKRRVGFLTVVEPTKAICVQEPRAISREHVSGEAKVYPFKTSR